jgi:hypothetical protein
VKYQKRSSPPSSREPNPAILTKKLAQFLRKFSSATRMPKARCGLSVFAIQLREPDYWIVIAGFEPTASYPFRILFDGSWKKAVDYFSKKAASLPKPEFIPFPVHEGETDFASICQEALREAVLQLPRALLTGDSSLSIYPAGIFVLKHGGILVGAAKFYFEAWFGSKRRVTISRPVFAPGRERKAFFCRFPIPVNPKRSRSAFKTKLYKELDHDKELLGERGNVRTFLFNGRVKILIFPSGLIVADERHRDVALEALGAFLAYSFFRGAGCIPVGIKDVGSITIKASGEIGGSSGELSSGRFKALNTAAIPAPQLSAIVRSFVKGIDPELVLDLRLLHQAVFHFRAGEHLQSFTLAWTVLERRMNHFWRLRIAERGFAGKRLDELCEVDRYTMSVVVDMLEVASELSPEEAGRIHSLRKSRNKAMHEGRVPAPDIARDCVHLAIEVVGKQWKDLKFDLDTL